MSPLPITISDQIAEVRRELALRDRVYPRMVEGGKLKQRHADRQIAIMQAVLATLERLA